MPLYSQNQSENFKVIRMQDKINVAETFFQFKQHKLFTTQAINWANATSTGTWTSYTGNFRPLKAKDSEPNLNYSTNNALYEGMFSSSLGFTSASAGATRTQVVNIPIDNLRVHRVSLTSTTAGTYTFAYFSDVTALTQIGSATVVVGAGDLNKTLYSTMNLTIVGAQPVVGNTTGQIAGNVAVAIPTTATVRAVRVTHSAIGMTVFEKQISHNADFNSGVLHKFGLSCYDSFETERNLETADQICNSLIEGTTATGDGLEFKVTVNSTSIKMLALEWGQLARSETSLQVATLGDFVLGAGTFGGVALASVNVGTGLSIENLVVKGTIMSNLVSSPTLIELNNYMYDSVTGILYLNSLCVGETVTIATKQLKNSTVIDMKALELSYYISGQIVYKNSLGQDIAVIFSKGQIVSITSSSDDANDKFELTMKLYPDTNKNFGQKRIS